MKNFLNFAIVVLILSSCAGRRNSTVIEPESNETSTQEKANFPRAEWKKVKVKNEEREFLVRMPNECLKLSCPLVFVFHGGMGDPEQIEKHSGFTETAIREKFIVVYPRGQNRQWNDGRAGQNDDVDDIAFFDVMWESLKAEYKFDRRRVFTTGISNGGFFSFRLACERSEIILAAAPVAANHSVGVLDKCRPKMPVAILNIVGTDDQAVPYNGGVVTVLLRIRKRGEVLSSDQTIQSWIANNKCSKAVKNETIDKIKNDETSVQTESYEDCKSRMIVRRMSVIGGGHTWPGHPPTHRGSFHSAVTSMEIDATEEIWGFFKTISPKL